MNQIASHIKEIEDQLNQSTRLIAVSKRQSNDKILDAYNSGFIRFGENYVQELVSKQEELPKDIEWHMIGHLQSNKVKYIAPFVSLIHSVDSFKLLKEINKQALKNDRIIDCLLQVHIAKEDTKTGFDQAELLELLNSDLSGLKNVNIKGLMGMSTLTHDKNEIEEEFKALQSLFEQIKKDKPELSFTELSMGMSGDWPLAMKNGSTLIRVGSAIFGERL
ncbi:YggS family pyridoxal phosphate-dependent enzyme [Arcticibacterium luteifluviistationis]|uniref:Pyridoxal phosphate homeostasis protein n=1 Tax=Arcticibacterium luteifluviistationis TaxID=1784714 RepID=A0A2Z4G9A1_9BACT|nr:YggS family pyridoxal phosphate-dependent enzyme [Arcticibacterium luteifluviistationis]AWV97746.1 YggS family pyridoxal phosphate-dependent enzyme [Arcticibacterium luteifluviistationis]